MSKLSKKLRTGTILAVIAAFLWAMIIILTKFIIRAGDDPLNVIFWLTILATPFWLGMIVSKKEEVKKMEKKDYQILLLIGLVGPLLGAIVEIFALKYTQATNFSFLIRSSLLFTIIFAALFLGERVTKKKLTIATLILIGAYLIATSGKIIHLSLGDGLTLLEAALIAFGNTILGKIAIRTMSSQLSAAGSFLVSVLPVIVLTFATKSFAIPHAIGLILVLTVVEIVSVLNRFNAYKYCSASFLAMTYSATPVIVTVSAFFLLGEQLS
ncbi:MAG: DMT family transporter, partial [bacterium]|nr:DMT family transporter [bacterium]